MTTTANFNYNGTEYSRTEKGYFYKVEAGKKIRIKQAEYEQAFENLTDDAAENNDVELEEFTEMIANRKAEQDRKDAETEASFNKKTAKKRTRKSKDIAFEGTVVFANEEFKVTLTAKQVQFIKDIPTADFYDNGIESSLWVDCIADTIKGIFRNKPMSVGAMISTLREKSIIVVGEGRPNGKKAKYFSFTGMGMEVAKALGLN